MVASDDDTKSSTADVDRLRKRLEDADAQRSSRGGIGGLVENMMRNFKVAFHMLALMPMYVLMALTFAGAAWPGVSLYRCLAEHYGASAGVAALSLGAGLVLFGFGLMLILPAVNLLIGRRVKPFRGPYYSLPAIRWYMHNGIAYVLRYTFLPFITPSPFNLWFFKAMGMKVGEGSIINSEFISDPSLIELGRKVTIGGSVTIIAHYGVGGYLVVLPVKIGDGVTLGIKSTIMAGVEIGDFARIMPHAVVLPKTKIPAGETWGGVPAKKIDS